MTSLMLKPEEVRQRYQIEQMVPPQHTRTWYPMGFANAMDVVDDTLNDKGLDVLRTTIGIARKETQLFASWELLGSNDEHAFTIAMRGSIDKSLSWSIIGGLTVSACSNLDLWSGTHKVIRKNTRLCQVDLRRMANELVNEALPEYATKSKQLESWTDIPVTQDEGFGFLGKAFGHGIVNTRQLAAATESWKESQVEEHRQHNAFGLYAGLTEGLKRGPLGESLERYSQARDYFVATIEGAS